VIQPVVQNQKTKNSRNFNPRGSSASALNNLVQVVGESSQNTMMMNMMMMMQQQQQQSNMMFMKLLSSHGGGGGRSRKSLTPVSVGDASDYDPDSLEQDF
jgi:hypothetical protein